MGCQDIAWDIVGATVELDLPDRAAARLRAVVARKAGQAVEPALVALFTPCYLAFQLGAWTMAADAAAGDPVEAERLRRRVGHYARRLRQALLERGDGGTGTA